MILSGHFAVSDQPTALFCRPDLYIAPDADNRSFDVRQQRIHNRFHQSDSFATTTQGVYKCACLSRLPDVVDEPRAFEIPRAFMLRGGRLSPVAMHAA